MQDLVLLHGWGKRGEDYRELVDLLSQKYRVFGPDLPGFGAEPLPRPFTLEDYANWLQDYLEKNKIKDPVLVGHSFGGRVAIKLATSHQSLVTRLVLLDSGGIERKGLIIRVIGKIGRIGGAIPEEINNFFRSKDYQEATGFLRETLKNVVNENLEYILDKIKIPTLIIWGRNDHTTPIWHGELMHKLINNSELIVIDGDHGIPYRRAGEVYKAINGNI